MNEKLYEEYLDECARLTAIINNSAVGSDEWKAAYDRKLVLLDKMTAFNKVETDYYTRSEDRKLQMDLEKEKQKLSWQRITFEMAKILIPLGITIAVRQKEQKDIFDFETHGRLTSTVARQFKLQDLFWKK